MATRDHTAQGRNDPLVEQPNSGGFRLVESVPAYVSGLKVMTYLYRGVARPVSEAEGMAAALRP